MIKLLNLTHTTRSSSCGTCVAGAFGVTPVTHGLRVDLSKPDVTENDNTLPAGHLRITKGPRAPSRVGSSSGPSFGRAWNYDE